MNKKIAPVIMMIATLFTVSLNAQLNGPGGYTTMTFNNNNFNQSLTNAVGPNVMGYQYVLIKNGQLVTEGAGGKAANVADGNRNMTTSTPHNLGSLSKFLSGTAMLHLMVKPAGPGGAWDNGLSLSQKLDRPFTTIVPDVWIDGNKAGIENITIRQLLQHRSGFDTDKSDATGRDVLDYLKDDDGYLAAQHGQREYANINFALNGYLLTMYEYPGAKDIYNNSIDFWNLNQTDADALVKQQAGTLMHSIMKTRIWDNMTPTISPNCDSADTLQNTMAYFYNSKNDNTNGGTSSIMNVKGHCGGEGGYFLSSRALANYLAHFSATDVIVNEEARNLMFNDTISPNDRLVWGSSRTNAWIADKFNMQNIAWSNGTATNAAGDGYKAVIIRLPQKYYLVVMTNSPELSTTNLFDAGVNAFRAGMEHNF